MKQLSQEALPQWYFMNFVQELAQFKVHVQSDIHEEEDARNSSWSWSMIQQHLIKLVEGMNPDFGGDNPQKARVYSDLRFICTVLADDIFLGFQWPGKDIWCENLLETHFYRTNAAGETFFVRIEEMLRDRDPSSTESARLYFWALVIGFRGRYTDPTESSILERFRERLYHFIYHKEPSFPRAETAIFPRAMEAMDQLEPKGFPDTKKWFLLAAVLLSLIGIASSTLWWQTVSEVAETAERIVEQK